MPKKGPSQKAINAVLKALDANGLPPIESLSDLNPAQKNFIADVVAGRECQVMCSRRAGKSYGICLALAIVAKSRKCNSIYLGLTAPAVKKSIWLEIWVPLITKYFPQARLLESEMLTIFENCSTVAFMGSDDLRYVTTQLGASLSGLAIVDEGQSQPDQVLSALIDVILPPALSDDKGEGSGTLVLSGTFPDIPYGRYWESWKAPSHVRKHTWNRFTNGYLLHQQEELAKFLASRPNLTINSPIVRKDWFGEEVFDESMRAWSGFCDALYPDGNLFEGDVPQNLNFFSGAADPGGGDEFAIELFGWNERDPKQLIWHVEEWCAPKDSRLPWSVPGAEIQRLDNQYRPSWVFDSTSGNTMDLIRSDFGVIMMPPAHKTGFKQQLDRANDLLAQRRILIRKGSALHRDMMLAKLSKKWLTTHQGDPWDSSFHGNPHDCMRYALAAYFDSGKGALPPKPQTDAEREAAYIAKMRTQGPVKPKTPQDGLATNLFGAKSQDLTSALAPKSTNRRLGNGYDKL